MYRFRVLGSTHWGDTVVESMPCLGGWDIAKAIPPMATHYPSWKSEEVDVSDSGQGLERKYLKRGINGMKGLGANRRAWMPES